MRVKLHEMEYDTDATQMETANETVSVKVLELVEHDQAYKTTEHTDIWVKVSERNIAGTSTHRRQRHSPMSATGSFQTLL